MDGKIEKKKQTDNVHTACATQEKKMNKKRAARLSSPPLKIRWSLKEWRLLKLERWGGWGGVGVGAEMMKIRPCENRTNERVGGGGREKGRGYGVVKRNE